MPEDAGHPRAKALRVTYALLAAWFLLASVALGFISGDSAASIVTVAMLAVGFVLGIQASDRLGLAPSGAFFSKRRRTAVAVTAVVAVLNAIATLVWLAAAHKLSVPPSVGSAAVSVACIVAALSQMLATR